MVRLVLFDVDGTLIRTGGAGVKAFAKVFQTEFGVVDGFDRLSFPGGTDYAIVREFLEFHGMRVTKESFSRFFDRYVFWLDEFLKQSDSRICAGVKEFLHGLKIVRCPPIRGLLTGNVRLGAEIKLRHLGLWDEFQTGAFAEDHEDRDQIAATARERGGRLFGRPLAGEEILVVGDTPLDIRCARAIGAKVLAVGTGGATLAELQKHNPDWALPDLAGAEPSRFL
jgi:phosphoglycolate phosphatase-like HAD superfamily hydrolase